MRNASPSRNAGASRAAAAILAAAAWLAASSCGGGGSDMGGGQSSPAGLKEISPAEYERLTSAPRPATASPDTTDGKQEYLREGLLDGTGDSDRFGVTARRKRVDITFTWPKGEADFWVKVYGREDNELGDFDLDEGEIIQLLGGGKFTVEVYSRRGGGRWRAAYRD